MFWIQFFILFKWTMRQRINYKIHNCTQSKKSKKINMNVFGFQVKSKSKKERVNKGKKKSKKIWKELLKVLVPE